MTESAAFLFELRTGAPDTSSETASAALLAAVSLGSSCLASLIQPFWKKFMAHAATRPAPTPTIRSVATTTVRVVANGRDIGCPRLAIVVSAFCHWSGRVSDPLLCGVQRESRCHGYLIQGPM